MLPETFAEQHIRVYSKLRDDESVRNLRRAFKKWCLLSNCTTPKVNAPIAEFAQWLMCLRVAPQGNADDPELTPANTPMSTPIKVRMLCA